MLKLLEVDHMEEITELYVSSFECLEFSYFLGDLCWLTLEEFIHLLARNSGSRSVQHEMMQRV